MTLPDPPYGYDDPRITYDEHCFFYDGDGYDNVCLTRPTAVVVRPKVGGSVSSNRRRQQQKEPQLPFVNVFIQIQLAMVNDVFYSEPPKVLRFAGRDAPISVFVNGVQFDTRFPYVSGEMVQTLKEKPEDLNASIRFLESIQEKSDDEIMAENLESSIRDVELQVVEDYKKIVVETKLVEDKPELDVKATLIKDKP